MIINMNVWGMTIGVGVLREKIEVTIIGLAKMKIRRWLIIHLSPHRVMIRVILEKLLDLGIMTTTRRCRGSKVTKNEFQSGRILGSREESNLETAGSVLQWV